MDALGVSQPTVSRTLAPLVRAGRVRKVGAARSQRYLLPRVVAGVGADIPIMRVDTAGVPAPFGTAWCLCRAAPSGWRKKTA